jgi:hypothetical protein
LNPGKDFNLKFSARKGEISFSFLDEMSFAEYVAYNSDTELRTNF